VERVHIERQVVHLAVVSGYRGVDERLELADRVDEIPSALAVGTEDVRSVTMHVDAVLLLAVAEATDVVFTFYDETRLASSGGGMGKHGSIQTCSYYKIIISCHNSAKIQKIAKIKRI
jgi:hypothetical protein